MEQQVHTVGERTEKLCAVCREERGHVVASVNKRGRIMRVDCPMCGTRSTFRIGGQTKARTDRQTGGPYDRTRTYRTGDTMLHPTYGIGEVTSLIEPRKIDVLFPDRMRRLIHAHAQA